MDKLKRKGIPLGDYVKGKIYRGVLTGLNEAFVIDEATKARLLAEDPRSAEIIKPFLAGRDVKRYQAPKGDKYLILFPKGWTTEKVGKLIEQEAFDGLKHLYPAIARHLEPFADQARKRADQGDYWWELRACDYYQEFEKEKIVYQVFQVKPAFFFDENGFIANNAVWIIPEGNKTLLGILNSKMGWFLIKNYCTAIQNGYQLISKYLMQIPIPLKRMEKIELLVEEIQDSKRSTPSPDTTALESEIDRLVYALYDLTEAEIAQIEGGG
jgi:hypothetical protein